MILLCPIIDPELSTNIRISLGLAAASTYQGRIRQSYKSSVLSGLSGHSIATNEIGRVIVIINNYLVKLIHLK